MADDEIVTWIENYTCAPIHLFPTEDWPKGLWLVSGKNRVPNKYLDQLRAREVVVERRGKPTGKRFPGVELLKDLSETKVLISEGLHGNQRRGTQITIYAPGQVNPEEDIGPVPPASLEGYSEKGALEIIKRVAVSKDVLRDWARDKRKAVAQAAKARMAQS